MSDARPDSFNNDALPISSSLVVGNASDTGAIISGLTVDGVGGQALYGSLSLTTGFANGDLNGTVTNLHILGSNDVPEERLRGRLFVTGTAGGIDKNVLANVRGTVAGVFGDGESGSVTIDANMTGRIRGPSILDPGQAMTGQITGGGFGSHDLGLSGVFYAERN